MSEIKYWAIKYIRLSDADEKPGESDSVANQRRLLDEFLKKHPEIDVVGEKIDDGYSGIIFERPAFKEMMELIKEGKVNCCITKDLSRLGREYIETGRHLRQIFPSLGVRFIAINDNIDTLTDSGDDLTISVKSLVNDAYCRDISVKTRSSLRSKREDGEYVGASPVYGYKKSEGNHNVLAVDEYPASVVREIFSMRIDGMSSSRIADTLNGRGVLSPHQYKKDRGLPLPKKGFSDKDDAKWSVTTINRILKDETYTGTLIQGVSGRTNYKLREVIRKPADEWKRTEKAHEAIIKKSVYELVQRILLLDTRTSPQNDKVHIFSGLLICGCCGARMSRKTVPRKSVTHYYYWCPTGKKKGCENAVMLRENELKEAVFEIIKAHIANVASLEDILENLDADKMARELAKNLSEQVTENELRIDKINGFKSALNENLSTGVLTKDECKSLKNQYTEDAEKLTAANEQLKKEIDDILSCKHERMAWIEHFKEFTNLSEINRKTVINLIQYIKIISKNEIEIAFNYQAEYETALGLIQGGA